MPATPADKTRSFRSIGLLLLGAAGLCAVIAWEKYRSAVVTAAAISKAMDGIEFEASVPLETWIAAFFAVLLGVAGVRCLLEWQVKRNQNAPATMLPPK